MLLQPQVKSTMVILIMQSALMLPRLVVLRFSGIQKLLSHVAMALLPHAGDWPVAKLLGSANDAVKDPP